MLVLSRKVGERIVIGDGVTVVVLAVHGQQIRLGIEAPKDVSIRRQELPPLSEQARRREGLAGAIQ
jgi:carbon storage regulator